MAIELEDMELLAKPANGGVIAIEAKYHSTCMLSIKTCIVPTYETRTGILTVVMKEPKQEYL